MRDLAAQTTSLVSVSTAGLASGDNPSDDSGSDGIGTSDGIFDTDDLDLEPR